MIDFSNVNQWMVGNTEVVKAALNGTVVWKKPGWVDPSTPFYIEDMSGSEFRIDIYKNNEGAPTLTIEKSTDCNTWEVVGDTSTYGIHVNVPANGRLYLRCKTNRWSVGNSYWNYIINYDIKYYKIGGNITSLIYGSDFNGQVTLGNKVASFSHLFDSCYSLQQASELILPEDTNDFCYNNMFYDCTSLTTAPELPATTLARECYADMFHGCERLTTAPSILPATTLAPGCYSSMFRNCVRLTTAPELPATTVADYCCYDMFRNCRSLTTVPSILPATTLAQSCYEGMFYKCTSLTKAPTLPAPILVSQCYISMFGGCTNLNYIKCLATDISATECTAFWVNKVASSGTFVKDPNMNDWPGGEDGIPYRWTVQDATS